SSPTAAAQARELRSRRLISVRSSIGPVSSECSKGKPALGQRPFITRMEEKPKGYLQLLGFELGQAVGRGGDVELGVPAADLLELGEVLLGVLLVAGVGGRHPRHEPRLDRLPAGLAGLPRGRRGPPVLREAARRP